jgi:hypothetical protein
VAIEISGTTYRPSTHTQPTNTTSSIIRPNGWHRSVYYDRPPNPSSTPLSPQWSHQQSCAAQRPYRASAHPLGATVSLLYHQRGSVRRCRRRCISARWVQRLYSYCTHALYSGAIHHNRCTPNCYLTGASGKYGAIYWWNTVASLAQQVWQTSSATIRTCNTRD